MILMEIPQIKRMASSVLKCGVSRIKVTNVTEALQAMTKEDVRGLVKRGVVIRLQKKGVSRARAKKIAIQKKKGRKRGKGRKKGTKKARTPKKKVWMVKVRALRKKLNVMKKDLGSGMYRKLYKMVTGGFFKSKERLETYTREKKYYKSEKK